MVLAEALPPESRLSPELPQENFRTLYEWFKGKKMLKQENYGHD
jgi:hypothetical protein